MRRSKDLMIKRKIHFIITDQTLCEMGVRRSKVVSGLSKKYFLSERTIYRILDDRLPDTTADSIVSKHVQEYFDSEHMDTEKIIKYIFKK